MLFGDAILFKMPVSSNRCDCSSDLCSRFDTALLHDLLYKYLCIFLCRKRQVLFSSSSSSSWGVRIHGSHSSISGPNSVVCRVRAAPRPNADAPPLSFFVTSSSQVNSYSLTGPPPSKMRDAKGLNLKQCLPRMVSICCYG